ncbi:hypothetical protein V6N00_12590 [Tersicoccus sp. MR15.9]|uniref:hypothetical protein n=1 Tax=Tersicoccus mangrovi TaxID=3121635 RepID=UPI002FE58F68
MGAMTKDKLTVRFFDINTTGDVTRRRAQLASSIGWLETSLRALKDALENGTDLPDAVSVAQRAGTVSVDTARYKEALERRNMFEALTGRADAAEA